METLGQPLPDTAIEQFLRHIRNKTDVRAVGIANALLDAGHTIEQAMTVEPRLHLSVEVGPTDCYQIRITYVVKCGADVVGDGETWQVRFDEKGVVCEVLPNGQVFYD